LKALKWFWTADRGKARRLMVALSAVSKAKLI